MRLLMQMGMQCPICRDNFTTDQRHERMIEAKLVGVEGIEHVCPHCYRVFNPTKRVTKGYLTRARKYEVDRPKRVG